MTKRTNREDLAKPCPTCLDSHYRLGMRTEAIQPLPPGAMAPLGLDGKPQCHDCAAAGTLMRLQGLTWQQARIVVANDRQEQYRLPGVLMGLVQMGITRPSAPGDLERHHDWLKKHLLEEQ